MAKFLDTKNNDLSKIFDVELKAVNQHGIIEAYLKEIPDLA